MRRDLFLGLFLAMSACALAAQQGIEPPVNISASFADAGLEATRAIRHCSGTMFLEGGEVVAPPETQKFVDKAEGAAKTDAERAVAAIIKALFIARLNTNMGRAVITMYGTSPGCTERLRRQADADEAIAASEMQQKHCRVAIKVILRRRAYTGMPAACENISN